MSERFSLNRNRPARPASFRHHGGLKGLFRRRSSTPTPETSGRPFPPRAAVAGHCLAALLVLSALVLFPAVARSATVAFWVAPDGSDSAPGTREAPFQTLERARDAVQEVDGRQQNGVDVVVYLRDGTYRLEQPLVLDSRDSGANGGEVVYRAAPRRAPGDFRGNPGGGLVAS